MLSPYLALGNMLVFRDSVAFLYQRKIIIDCVSH